MNTKVLLFIALGAFTLFYVVTLIKFSNGMAP